MRNRDRLAVIAVAMTAVTAIGSSVAYGDQYLAEQKTSQSGSVATPKVSTKKDMRKKAAAGSSVPARPGQGSAAPLSGNAPEMGEQPVGAPRPASTFNGGQTSSGASFSSQAGPTTGISPSGNLAPSAPFVGAPSNDVPGSVPASPVPAPGVDLPVPVQAAPPVVSAPAPAPAPPTVYAPAPPPARPTPPPVDVPPPTTAPPAPLVWATPAYSGSFNAYSFGQALTGDITLSPVTTTTRTFNVTVRLWDSPNNTTHRSTLMMMVNGSEVFVPLCDLNGWGSVQHCTAQVTFPDGVKVSQSMAFVKPTQYFWNPMEAQTFIGANHCVEICGRDYQNS